MVDRHKLKPILRLVKELIVGVSLASLLAYATLKGVSSLEYRKLPKAQQKQVDILRAQDIKESAIRSDMAAVNEIASILKDIEKAIKNENYFVARGLIKDAENVLKTIKHMKNSRDELKARLAQLGQQINAIKQ